MAAKLCDYNMCGCGYRQYVQGLNGQLITVTFFGHVLKQLNVHTAWDTHVIHRTVFYSQIRKTL